MHDVPKGSKQLDYQTISEDLCNYMTTSTNQPATSPSMWIAHQHICNPK